VANVVKNQSLDAAINTAIAKACTGISDMDAAVDITITEEDVVNIYRSLTNMPEGVAMQHNSALSDILNPLLADRPDLATSIGGIIANNQAMRASLENSGLAIIERIQQSLSNN
jgi:hypothetical protein